MSTQFYPYSVTVNFEDGITPFNCFLYAENEEHAKVIAVHNATAHGWPKEASSFVIERID